MGACSTKDKKRVKKNNTRKDENPDDGNKEQNGNQDDIILLRSGKNNINFRNKQYTINIENLSTQITIVGNKVLKQILTDNFNFKENADFKIEFENNKIIGNDSIDIELGSIIQEIFGNDIPEIIKIAKRNTWQSGKNQYHPTQALSCSGNGQRQSQPHSQPVTPAPFSFDTYILH